MGERLRKEHASSSASTISIDQCGRWNLDGETHTAQTINRPLFKLLERDICCRRSDVEVQSVLVVQILVGGCRELFLAVVEVVSPFGIDSGKVLSDHLRRVARPSLKLSSFPQASLLPICSMPEAFSLSILQLQFAMLKFERVDAFRSG